MQMRISISISMRISAVLVSMQTVQLRAFVIMTSASEVERQLRAKPDDFVLKPNEAAKSDVWNSFSLIYRKNEAEPWKYFCACNGCRRVYMYKAADGGSFGTKNLIDHVRQCKGVERSGQLTLMQTMRQTPRVLKPDVEALKQKEVQFCAAGYHSFLSVENSGFKSVLQTCVDLGAKYGKFDVGEILAGRKAVSRETQNLAAKTKNVIKSRLKESIDDSTVALSIDMYTDDFRKKAYLDVHATWVERDFKLHHAVLAVRHFGTAAHTAVNISTAVNAILTEYGLSEDDTPVTTDHGSNIVAALRSKIRLDCLCHRLHTVLETAWRETKNADPEAAGYETVIADLCRYVKQASGVQEQLPTSLKHGGDTRPWTSMCRCAESVNKSYDTLVSVLTTRGMSFFVLFTVLYMLLMLFLVVNIGKMEFLQISLLF